MICPGWSLVALHFSKDASYQVLPSPTQGVDGASERVEPTGSFFRFATFSPDFPTYTSVRSTPHHHHTLATAERAAADATHTRSRNDGVMTPNIISRIHIRKEANHPSIKTSPWRYFSSGWRSAAFGPGFIHPEYA